MRHARRLALTAVAVASAGALAATGTPAQSAPSSASTDAGSSAPTLAKPGADEEAAAPVVADAPRYRSSGVTSVSARGKSARIDFRSLPRTKPVKRERPEPPQPRRVGSSKPRGGGSGSTDIAAQTSATDAAPFQLAGVNVDGMNFANNGAGHPPDTSGAVGPDAFVQTVNTSIGIYDKTGAVKSSPVTFNDFWRAANTQTACDNANYGDPFVLFDHVSRRWVIADFTVKAPYLQCFAISNANVADVSQATWHFFAVTVSNTDMGDYPKGAFHNGVLYMSANLFRYGQTFDGARVWAFDLGNVDNGSLRGIYATTGTSYGSLLPANGYWSDAVAGDWFVSLSTAALEFWKLVPNFSTSPASGTFSSSPTLLTVPSFTRASSVTEPSPGESLDALSDRLMYQLQLRNGHLFVNHSVQVGSQAGVRWYDVDVTGSVPTSVQSTYVPADGASRWMGSVGVDRAGNVAVGYSVIRGAAGAYPGVAVAGRTGSTTLSRETLLVAGGGVQINGYNRWGDYSQMSLDPDGCTLWYTQEYMADTSANWHTRIANLKFTSCTYGSTP